MTLPLAGAVGGPAAYSAADTSVTLSVDGQDREVDTHAETVGELLEHEDLDVGAHDAVAPSPDTQVEDGQRVAVRFGRQLDLTVDGEERTHWVTATDVGAALSQVGNRFADAELSASRDTRLGRDGLDLTVKTEKKVTLVVGDEKSTESVTALTATEALRELGVPFDDGDEISPGRDAEIEDGDRIELVRLDTRERTVKKDIAHDTVVRHDDDMLEGRERVERAGRDGVREVTYEVVLADGEKRKRTELDSSVKKEAVDRVVVRGTKEPATTSTGGASGGDGSSGGLSSAPCASGSGVESGLAANAVAVHRAVCAEFPGVESYGGVRPGDDGEHGSGYALDIMISDSAQGDAIAAFVRQYHSALGVTEVIWSQQIWTTERSSEGWRPMEDRGSATANHYDHVHVTVG